MALKRENEFGLFAQLFSPVHFFNRVAFLTLCLVTGIGVLLRPTVSQRSKSGNSNELEKGKLMVIDSLPKSKPSSMLTVTIRLIDAEADTVVANAQLSVVDEKNGQALRVLQDSRGFSLSTLPGTSLIIQATAPAYLAAKTRLFNVAESQPVIMKIMHTKPSVLTIRAFAGKINQPLSPATAIITSQTTGKTERYWLKNGLLKRPFTQPDELNIEVSAPGYTTASRQLNIEVPPLGKRYEFDAELDKVSYSLAVRAVDSKTNKVITGGRFRLTGPVGMAPILLSPSPAIGLFMANLPDKGAYQLVGNAEGYEDISFMIVTSKDQNEVLAKLTPIPPVVEPKPDIVVGELKSRPTAIAKETEVASVSAITTKIFGVIEKGKSIRLNKLYFDQSSPVLRPESYTELNQLYDVLLQYPSLRIEIRGFTDNQGDFDLNTQLSRDRCQAVINYLAGKGIRKSRLKALGRGPLDPVAPNNNEENRSKNRRVEFAIL